MPSFFVFVGRHRWSLADIDHMTKAQRRRAFPTRGARRKVTISFVARKLQSVRRGVEWAKVAW